MHERFSINSASLADLLGPTYRAHPAPDGAAIVRKVEPRERSLALDELPCALAARGIGHADLCYFHVPSTDGSDISALRRVFDDAGVGRFCLLIDYGDLTQPESLKREEELRWLADWVRVAGALGAQCARIVAGQGDPGDLKAMDRAVDGYIQLAQVADDVGVRLLTENIGDFARGADTLLKLLDRLDGKVGLVADFGNGRAVGDYADLQLLAARAESVHAKPAIRADGMLEEADFRRCVELCEAQGFDGPYTLVYQGPDDPWHGIERAKALVEEVVGG